jgi:hypothetical protein
MIGDGMPLGELTSDQMLLAVDGLSDQEERGMSVMFCEQIEQFTRVSGGTIIECQINDRETIGSVGSLLTGEEDQLTEHETKGPTQRYANSLPA